MPEGFNFFIIIIAFCSIIVAHSYSSSFLFLGQPQKVDLDSLDAFGPLGVSVQVVPKGVDVIPPKQTVEHLRQNHDHHHHHHSLDHLLDLATSREEGVLVQDWSWE